MVKRLLVYLQVMFPITSFVGTFLTGITLQFIYLRLFGLPAQFHYQMLLSGFVVTFVTLLIRIMDEFKDFEDDKRNFPDRPLPSGKVLPSDLKALAFVCVAGILGLSLFNRDLFWGSLVLLGYTLLMLKWFFIEEKMRISLPLALISHHPIVFLNVIYLILSIIVTFPGLDWSKLCYVLLICLSFTNWEISRKIRMPEQETAYTTYSMIWGPKVAILVSLSLQAIFISTVFVIFHQIGTPFYLRAAFAMVIGYLVWPFLRFLFTLKLKGPLKKVAENEILTVIIFLLVAAFL